MLTFSAQPGVDVLRVTDRALAFPVAFPMLSLFIQVHVSANLIEESAGPTEKVRPTLYEVLSPSVCVVVLLSVWVKVFAVLPVSGSKAGVTLPGVAGTGT